MGSNILKMSVEKVMLNESVKGRIELIGNEIRGLSKGKVLRESVSNYHWV